MLKHDLVLFYSALAVAGFLIAVGIVIYPDSSQVAAEASADVQSVRDIGGNR
jgi:hypothetical protein